MIPAKVPFLSTWITSLATHLPAQLMECAHSSVKKSLQQNSCQIHLRFMLIPAFWKTRVPCALCAATTTFFQVTDMACHGGWDNVVAWWTDRTAGHKNMAFKMCPSSWKTGEPVIYSSFPLYELSQEEINASCFFQSPPVRKKKKHNVGRDAIAMTGLLSLHNRTVSVEREHCLFLVL